MRDDEKHNRLSWECAPRREMLRLAWPIAVSMLSYSAMTIADTAFVAQLGASALAGVGIGGIVFIALICFPAGLLRGTKVLVAQAVGAGRRSSIDDYLSAALLAAASLSGLAVLSGFFAAPFAAALAPSTAAAAASTTYLHIRILSAPLVFAFMALREFSYGESNARSSMYASVAGNVVNIGLDYAFVCGLNLGVAGAAWATVIGTSVECVVMTHVLLGRALSLRGARERSRELWRVGMPTGVQFALEVGSFAILSAVIAYVGELDLAAHQIVLHLTHLSFLPAYAIAEAASIMAGQAIGARKLHWVGKLAAQAMGIALLYAALCTFAFAIGARWIAHVFTDDAALIAAVVPLIYVACGFLILDAANVVARSILRGVGDVRVPAVVSVATAWVCTPPIAWVAGVTLGLGALGGWIGLSAEIFVGAGIFWHRIRTGRWRKAAEEVRLEAERGCRP